MAKMEQVGMITYFVFMDAHPARCEPNAYSFLILPALRAVI